MWWLFIAFSWEKPLDDFRQHFSNRIARHIKENWLLNFYDRLIENRYTMLINGSSVVRVVKLDGFLRRFAIDVRLTTDGLMGFSIL